MTSGLLSCSCSGCFGVDTQQTVMGCGNTSGSIPKYSALRSFKTEACGMTQMRHSPEWKIEQHNKKGCGNIIGIAE